MRKVVTGEQIAQLTNPDPVRVRAGWVSDADIWAMAQECAEDAELRPIGAAA